MVKYFCSLFQFFSGVVSQVKNYKGTLYYEKLKVNSTKIKFNGLKASLLTFSA